MLTTARSLCALFTSYGLLILANGLFITLLSLRIKTEGYSTSVVGLLMAGYFLGMLLGARYASSVIQRSGYIRSFAAFASIMSISPLLHMLWVEPGFWLALRLVDGFCLAGLYLVTESWVNIRANNKNRGGILAFYMMVNFFAYGLSQLLLQAADINGFKLFALCAVLFSLSLIPLMLSHADSPQLEMSNKLNLRHLLQNAPAGFWGTVCTGAAYASFFTMAPVFSRELGLNTSEISYFMAAGIFGGLLLQISLGKLSDHFERRLVIAAVSLGRSVCCATLVWCAHAGVGFSSIVFSVFVFGSLAFVIYPMSVAHANDWCGQDKTMQTSSGLIVGYGSGAVLGPLLSSLLMVRFGPAALFTFIDAKFLALMLYCLWQSSVGHRNRKKVSFVPQPCDHPRIDTSRTEQPDRFC